MSTGAVNSCVLLTELHVKRVEGNFVDNTDYGEVSYQNMLYFVCMHVRSEIGIREWALGSSCDIIPVMSCQYTSFQVNYHTHFLLAPFICERSWLTKELK